MCAEKRKCPSSHSHRRSPPSMRSSTKKQFSSSWKAYRRFTMNGWSTLIVGQATFAQFVMDKGAKANEIRTSSSNRRSWITFGTALILTHFALLMYLSAYSSRVCLCWTTRTCRGCVILGGPNDVEQTGQPAPTFPKAPLPTDLRRTKWKRVTSPSKSIG